jgi:hypothetical protein
MHDYLYAVVFVVALASSLVCFAVLWSKWRKVAWISLVAFLGSYCGLTFSGEYAVTNHGGSDWRREWLPKFLMVERVSPTGRAKSDITLLGAVYWPCIVIDRLVWHRTSVASLD